MQYFIYKKIFRMANNYSYLQKDYKINYFGLQNYYFGIRAKFIRNYFYVTKKIFDNQNNCLPYHKY